MSHSERNFAHWDEAVQAAREALDAKRYDDAKHHLQTALNLGANSTHVRKLQTLIKIEEEQQDKIAQHGGFFGFWLAFVCYFLLSFLLPPTRGAALWGAIAFVAIPAIIGWRVGRWFGYDVPPRFRFWGGFRALGGAVWIYAFLNMLVARAQFSMSGACGDVVLVWLLIPAFYGAIAGSVAGVASAKLAWRREESQA